MREHIVINSDRSVTVPDSLKKIGIQYDHNVNTLTFDCPRYADDAQSIDMSKMQIFINWMLPDKSIGCSIAENIIIDEADSTLMHFDWIITSAVTPVFGILERTLVCIKQTDTDGREIYHWNTDLFQKFSVGEGMECNEQLAEENMDVITQLLVKMDAVDTRTSTEAMRSYVGEYMTENPPQPSDEQANAGVDAYMTENGQDYVNTYMGENAQSAVNTYMDVNAQSKVNTYMEENAQEHMDTYMEQNAQNKVDDYLERNPLQLDNTLTDPTKAAPADKVGEIGTEVDELKGDLDTLNQGGLNLKEDFIGQQVNKWLDKHPEATTTVQDGSLTSDKFTDDLKLHTLKDYVTPEMFGAKGDGATDDTKAIQNAIDTNKPVFFKNKYKITSPLSIRNHIVLFGEATNKTLDNNMYRSCIISSTDIFTSSQDHISDISIENMNFKSTNNGCSLFIIGFDRSYISRIYTNNLSLLNVDISGDGCNYITVKDSYFLSTEKFIRHDTKNSIPKGIVDSVFDNNYFSGKCTKDSIFARCYFSNTRFVNNYFDFWYRVFDSHYHHVGLIVDKNIFDFSIQIFSGLYAGSYVTNNIFNSPTSSTIWNDLDSNEIIAVFSHGLYNYTKSIANTINGYKYYIYCNLMYPNTKSLSKDNILLGDTSILWNPYPNDNTDLLDTRIEELNYKEYPSLQNASLTGGNSERFNHQIVFVNKVAYINHNGTWIQLSNPTN